MVIYHPENYLMPFYRLFLFLGIELKIASKFFGQKFATGSSASNTGEIVIQGDVKYELMELIPQKWPEVSLLI